MKHRGEHAGFRGEGWLIAAALLAVLLLSLAVCLHGQPRARRVESLHAPTEALWDAAQLNVNSADAGQLAELPGLGPALAERIVERRDTYGPFASVDELMQVHGIGEGRLDALRPYIRVE